MSPRFKSERRLQIPCRRRSASWSRPSGWPAAANRFIIRAMTTMTWDAFFVASSGATAALAGLVFIGISINLEQVLAVPGLDLRALEALTLLVAALLLSLLVLVPDVAPLVFAAAALIAAVFLAVVST